MSTQAWTGLAAMVLAIMSLALLWIAWSMAEEGRRRTVWLRKRGYRR